MVGHIGRFNQQKNHTFLIDVFYELWKKKPEARLVLVGKGELEESVRKKVRDMSLEPFVVFTGVRQDVPNLMSAFDVFLFPSLYEGMPNTVIEAQATGLRCILSDTITREAKLSEDVTYISLKESTVVWSEELLKLNRANRFGGYKVIVDNNYDIESATNRFIEVVFERN